MVFSVVVLLPLVGLLLVWLVVDDSEDFVAAAGAPGEPVSPVAPVAPGAPAGPGVTTVSLHPAAPRVPTKIAIAAITVYVVALFIEVFIVLSYHGESSGSIVPTAFLVLPVTNITGRRTKLRGNGEKFGVG